FVEKVGCNAGDQSVVPEAPVAHYGDRPLFHVRRYSRRAGERHAVAKDGIAKRKRRKSRERVATDIGTDMGRPEFALHQLDGGKDGTLRTAGTEGGRTRRQRAQSRSGFCLMRDKAARLFSDGIG